MTKYYDIFWVVRYKKELNDLRQYLLQQLNEQVLQQVSDKNQLSTPPKLVIKNILTNTDLDEALENYENDKISYEEIVKFLSET